ncbi:hypothetical protein J437_LFUL007770 [Ladona fulva]|uniref:Uncharacterized protein n=1 Tax=Ladona fulva TaxID=123851 RepID=A0A8K0K6R0_LADFU|nr:hypothetical protein J437_LFUL007770 [Ladona fulva]
MSRRGKQLAAQDQRNPLLCAAVSSREPMLGRCRRRGVLGPGFSVASGGGSGVCPGEDSGGEYYRLRSFSITSKGVINCGDSFRSRRRSRSINSVSSVASSQSGGGRGDVAGGGRERIPSCGRVRRTRISNEAFLETEGPRLVFGEPSLAEGVSEEDANLEKNESEKGGKEEVVADECGRQRKDGRRDKGEQKGRRKVERVRKERAEEDGQRGGRNWMETRVRMGPNR